LTLTFIAFVVSDLGIRTVRTPFLYEASILFGSTSDFHNIFAFISHSAIITTSKSRAGLPNAFAA
jgi:hypothetical protein